MLSISRFAGALSMLGAAALLTIHCPAALAQRDPVAAAIRQQVLARAGGATHSRPRYFLVPFAFQDDHNSLGKAHTFATFERVVGRGSRALSEFTISWLPADFAQNTALSLMGSTRPGHDFTLDETLAFARELDVRVVCWGPYEITPDLYRAGVDRLAELRSGAIDYVENDHGHRARGEAINCMRAVSDLAGDRESFGGFLNTGIGVWGIKGTRHVLEHLAKHGSAWFVDPVDLDGYVDVPSGIALTAPPSHRGRARM